MWHSGKSGTTNAETAFSQPHPITATSVARLVSSDSIAAGGLTPGTILAERYRIIGLLSSGGMEEVYRYSIG